MPFKLMLLASLSHARGMTKVWALAISSQQCDSVEDAVKIPSLRHMGITPAPAEKHFLGKDSTSQGSQYY